jgi:hypothetical protein
VENINIKIITFNIYKDYDEWYAKSTDSMYILGETIEVFGESLQDLQNQVYIEINNRCFDEYDIDMFTNYNKIELLLTKGIPLIPSQTKN